MRKKHQKECRIYVKENSEEVVDNILSTCTLVSLEKVAFFIDEINELRSSLYLSIFGRSLYSSKVIIQNRNWNRFCPNLRIGLGAAVPSPISSSLLPPLRFHLEAGCLKRVIHFRITRSNNIFNEHPPILAMKTYDVLQ